MNKKVKLEKEKINKETAKELTDLIFKFHLNPQVPNINLSEDKLKEINSQYQSIGLNNGILKDISHLLMNSKKRKEENEISMRKVEEYLVSIKSYSWDLVVSNEVMAGSDLGYSHFRKDKDIAEFLLELLKYIEKIDYSLIEKARVFISIDKKINELKTCGYVDRDYNILQNIFKFDSTIGYDEKQINEFIILTLLCYEYYSEHYNLR